LHLQFSCCKFNTFRKIHAPEILLEPDFAFYMIEQARKQRVNDIFKLDGNVYAFDSTTIDLCLQMFPWAKFRKHKGGIKVHTLYDVETQVSAFIHITEAKVNDIKAMGAITY
jgi:hypothetical protein